MTPPSNEELNEAQKHLGVPEEELPLGDPKRLAPSRLGSVLRDSEIREPSPEKNSKERSISPPVKRSD